VAAAGRAIFFYLGKCLWPLRPVPVYPRWPLNDFWPGLVLPWLTLLGVLGWLWAKRTTWGRHALLGGGFFLLNLAPVLGFVPMAYQRYSWVADHFVYLPLIGLIGLVAAAAGAGMARATPSLAFPLWSGMAIVGGLLMAEGHRYAGAFANEELLWTYATKGSPTAWLAQLNLGNALLQNGRTSEAIAHYERALQLKPDYAEAHCCWANALGSLGRWPEATAHPHWALGGGDRALPLGLAVPARQCGSAG